MVALVMAGGVCALYRHSNVKAGTVQHSLFSMASHNRGIKGLKEHASACPELVVPSPRLKVLVKVGKHRCICQRSAHQLPSSESCHDIGWHPSVGGTQHIHIDARATCDCQC